MSWAHQRGKRGGSSRKCQHPPPPPHQSTCADRSRFTCVVLVCCTESSRAGAHFFLHTFLGTFYIFWSFPVTMMSQKRVLLNGRRLFQSVLLPQTKNFAFKKKKGNSQPWPPPQTKLPIMQCPQRITFYSLPPAYANVFMAHLLKTRKGRQVWWGSIVGDEHRRIL